MRRVGRITTRVRNMESRAGVYADDIVHRQEAHMKRIASLAAAAAIMVLSTPAWSQAAAQRPVFETTKVEGTDNVYIFRAANAQSMFVVTSAGVIATDPISYARPEASSVYL